MHIPIKLVYLLLAPCLYLLYSTIFYSITAFPYDTLPSSTDSMPISMVLYYLLLASFLYLNTLLSATGLVPIPMALHYILLAHCLYLSYSTTFYRIPAYPYGTLLSSTGFLPIPMVLYYILLAHCLSLWYSTIFSSGSTVFNKIQFIYMKAFEYLQK